MLYVDDKYFDKSFFTNCDEQFGNIELLKHSKGKRFAVCLNDPAQWIALCLYLKKKGASLFPLPSNTPFGAAMRQAQRSHSHFLIYQDIGNITPLLQRNDDTRHVLVQMSSGTTGEPKIIERDWAHIDLEVQSYVDFFKCAEHMAPIIACPVNHSYGLISGVFVAMKRGLAPVIINNLNPKYVIRKMYESENPILYSSPMLIHTITLLFPKNKKMHAVMTSGTTIREALFEHLKKRTQFVFQQYGCSECGCISIHQNPVHGNEIGTPLPHLSVTAGGSATNPEEIIVISSDKQVPTRDLGYFDGSGNLCYVSRIDDMINVAGVNVYPAEVENVIMEIQEIEDAVVYKKENGLGHIQVCLNYVSHGRVSDMQIREWCSTQLAPHQKPFEINEVEHISRLPNGKINRKNLATANESSTQS